MLQLKDLKKVYPSKPPVVALDGVTLNIDEGAVYGVIGLSGAGKSTLIRCIDLLERPTEGRILIDGVDVTFSKRKELAAYRRNISMIFQNFNLLEQRTALKNVRFPLELTHTKRDAANARAKELLELVGLGDKLDAYPSQLSGGQKQRVAIARALASSPKYLLCDEPTSALDPNTTTSILQLLKRVNAELGVTMIIITHEMKVVESICTDVAVISEGKIAEEGKVTDVFSHPVSRAARELLLPDFLKEGGKGKLRLVFDGGTSDAPVISALAMERGVALNVLFADTRTIDGKTYGHMVVDLPDDPVKAEEAKRYLAQRGVKFEEE